MATTKIAALVLIAFVVGSFAAKNNVKKPKRPARKSLYGFYNFEKSFCQHGIDGKGKKDGNYAHPKYCERFITCERFEHGTTRTSKVTTQYCPNGLFFNEKNGVCDWPRNVQCFKYQGKTCYGAKRNRFGRWRSSETGYLEALKLVHVSGYVTCKAYKKIYKSFWGCNAKVQNFNDKLNTWITTRKNDDGIIFPIEHTPFDPYGNYYSLTGYHQLSPYVKWYADPIKPTKVKKGQQLRIWYGEDLHDIHEFDNKGRHCVEVYALFSYYKPFYFLNH